MKINVSKKTSLWLSIAFILTLFISLLTACAKRQEDPHSIDDEIYMAVEHSAEFPGGIDAFYDYIEANMHYPERAIQDKVQGKVYVVFIVEKDGSLTDVKVLRGIGSG